ncbi:putative 39S ribosomal protein L45 mitochondrial [Taenia crassiceps]|uniref:39S ribosomal protein L45 mitochondrial n=1 Tax=Taenia crassiceps TaxID=6207 RepID=A0ABR4QSS0_9CEST
MQPINGLTFFSTFSSNSPGALNCSAHMALLSRPQILLTSVRFIRHKPWIPKFRLIRQMQPWVQPFDPDLVSIGGKSGAEGATSSELREHLRRNGLMPPLLFQEQRINLTHSGRIFDEYVPPEGDGKSSLLSTGIITDAKDSVMKKAKTARAALRIRKHKPMFSISSFPLEADAIYKEVHTILPKSHDNQERILELTTEKAFVEMTEGLKLRTLHWEFAGSLEPPRVVSCRTEEAMDSAPNTNLRTDRRTGLVQPCHVVVLCLPSIDGVFVFECALACLGSECNGQRDLAQPPDWGLQQ